MTPADALLAALAEHLATLDEWTIYNVGEGDMTQQELCQALAKTALVFVAERLQTREQIARRFARAAGFTFSEPPAPSHWHDADALLRDLRGRLEVRE